MNKEQLEGQMFEIDVKFKKLVEENDQLNITVRNNEIEKYKLQGEYRLLQRQLDEYPTQEALDAAK